MRGAAASAAAGTESPAHSLHAAARRARRGAQPALRRRPDFEGARNHHRRRIGSPAFAEESYRFDHG
jgi:hypothetical protein